MSKAFGGNPMAMPLPENLSDAEMKEQYTLTIKADYRSGLLHLVTGIIEKKLIGIISFNLYPPEADGTVLMTTAITINPVEVKNLALRLRNIVEVFTVAIIDCSDPLNNDGHSSPEKWSAQIAQEVL